jgi:RNA polymerase sigma-70 factor (ECF subfamily)
MSDHRSLADHAAGEQVIAVGDRLALEAALRDVPDDFRVPVVLRDVADLDYQEIADMLDMPIGTVKSRIARGRLALAAAFGNQTTSDERPNERS